MAHMIAEATDVMDIVTLLGEPLRPALACPFCSQPSHAKACQPQRLADLLSAHATAWWRSWSEDDYVEQVNESYDAYIAAGGNDAHYDAHWRSFSDTAKAATKGGA